MEDVRSGGGPQAGFTLVETLIAIIVLVFGLMAVANLFAVAASTNTLANHSTAATISAVHVMEMLKSSPFLGTAVSSVRDAGGTLTLEAPTAANLAMHVACDVAQPGDKGCVDRVPGVGTIHVHWQVVADAADVRLAAIRVRAQGVSGLMGERSRAELTTFVVCSNATDGNSCGM